MVSTTTAIALCLRLTTVALVISSIEPLVAWRFFSRSGPLWSRLSRLQELTSLRFARPVHELVARDWVFLGLCATQLMLSVAVFVDPNSLLGWVLLVVAALVFVRLRVGLDASDAMTRIILTANAIRLIHPEALDNAFVLFVGLEACLAYFTSGFYKLGAIAWIDGRSLAKILSTVSYGDPAVSRLLWRHPNLTRLGSWSTVTIEVLFPLALIAPIPLAGAILMAGALFHIACARIMALGSFVWAFVATYGCVLACRSLLPTDSMLPGLLLFYAIAVAGQLWATLLELRAKAKKAPSTAPDLRRG